MMATQSIPEMATQERDADLCGKAREICSDAVNKQLNLLQNLSQQLSQQSSVEMLLKKIGANIKIYLTSDFSLSNFREN